MIVVLGCGNPNRRDDGVGPEVVRMLRERGVACEDVRLIDAGTDGMAAMFSARGCTTLVIVDASTSGSEPGAVFEVPGTELEQAYEPGLNLHDFRWDHALYAGRRIFRDSFPDDVTVLLIEAETTDFGLGLSVRVVSAAVKVVDRVVALIEAHKAAIDRVRVTLTVKRGSLYLGRADYERFFPGLETLILLRCDDDFLVLPARGAIAGGFMLKLRNAAGDRVVHAAEFFRAQDIDDDCERVFTFAWSEARAGLESLGAFTLQT